MIRTFSGLLLALLLLGQTVRAPMLLQWQQLATESFTELFCVNKDVEPVPMCFGSCQVTDLLNDITSEDGEGISSTSLSPASALYCWAPAILPDLQRAPPLPIKKLHPRTVPRFLSDDFTGGPLHPPMFA